MKSINLLAILVVLILFSCKKEKEVFPEYTSLKINISYSIEGVPLIFDSIMYTNDEGEMYEVNKLEYYISNITFHRPYGDIHKTNKIFYVNANTPLTNTIILDSIPTGKYSYITFNIGLDASRNISNSLPNTMQNINMAWPTMMGGGYHFMKLEGHYLIGSSNYGYAMHLGINTSLVSCKINEECFVGYPNPELGFNMNINEWYRTPLVYSFNTDGNSIMGDSLLMTKIATNGFNVFSLKK